MTGSTDALQRTSTPGPDAPAVEDEIEDLVDDDTNDPIAIPVIGPVFDPEPEREKRRGQLAIGSFVFLAVIVLLLMVPVVVGWREWDDMEGVSNAVLPVVVGIVGTVNGFYFGLTERKR